MTSIDRILGQLPHPDARADQDGSCTVCGLPFEEDNGGPHICPPEFRRPRAFEATAPGRRFVGDPRTREVVIVDGDRREPLPPRNDLRNHSPDGFNWGYGGSGPSQLALAMACAVLGDDAAAMYVYQDVKWRLVSVLDQTKGFDIHAAAVLEVIAACMKRG